MFYLLYYHNTILYILIYNYIIYYIFHYFHYIPIYEVKESTQRSGLRMLITRAFKQASSPAHTATSSRATSVEHRAEKLPRGRRAASLRHRAQIGHISSSI